MTVKDVVARLPYNGEGAPKVKLRSGASGKGTLIPRSLKRDQNTKLAM
jgi:hypothetical protein